MGYNLYCDPCAKGLKPKECEKECQCREVVKEVETCPVQEMTTMPILTATIENNHNPNAIGRRHIFEIVVDLENSITYFYDIFGIGTIISNDGAAVKRAQKAVEEKQNAITDHSAMKNYKTGDIVIQNGRLYRAVQDNIGQFNETNWQSLA